MHFDQTLVYEAFVTILMISVGMVIPRIAEPGNEPFVAGDLVSTVTADSHAALCISYAERSYNGNPINLLCLHKC